ncbi:hypothetical protein TNCV_4742761 [Trichonephila clavipes]|nr:hypothetical protein TNCV_4742761 [Trichonephila clavipes]
MDLSTSFQKNPEGPELTNMITNITKMVAKVTKVAKLADKNYWKLGSIAKTEAKIPLNRYHNPDGHGYELVSSVRALVPQKFSVEEELMHVKHFEVKRPHVGVMWKFGRGVISSGIVLVT